jgi:hypothetical protein
MKSGVVVGFVLCGACGAEQAVPNPFTISGGVNLRSLPDGGSNVGVFAFLYRPLADGGSEEVTDAGVALNGVPLGPGDVDAIDSSLGWNRPSFAGAGFELQQTLSVIGSSPEARATFTCPAPVSFTAPLEGAVLKRGQPVELAWTPGGSSSFDKILLFQSDFSAGGQLFFGFALLLPDITSTQFTFPSDHPDSDVRVTFSLFVSGESLSPNSSCEAVPMRSVVFP